MLGRLVGDPIDTLKVVSQPLASVTVISWVPEETFG